MCKTHTHPFYSPLLSPSPLRVYIVTAHIRDHTQPPAILPLTQYVSCLACLPGEYFSPFFPRRLARNYFGCLLIICLQLCFITKKLVHVSRDVNRSVDAQLCKLRETRSRVFHYFPRDRLLAGDPPGCYQGRRDDNTYRIDFHLISASTISCTDAMILL